MPQLAPRKADAATALRLAGATYDEIARTLDYKDADSARKAVEIGLSQAVSAHDKAHLRELTTRRYERLLRGLWQKATDPESPDHLPAARAAREIVDRMVVLQGIAEPTEVVVHTPATAEIAAWVEQMAQVKLPKVVEADPFALPGEVHDAEVVNEEDLPRGKEQDAE